jgi:hypothetical protein
LSPATAIHDAAIGHAGDTHRDDNDDDYDDVSAGSICESEGGVEKPKPTRTRARTSTVLHKCNLQAGHGGASGRYEQLRELADEYAFVVAAAYQP